MDWFAQTFRGITPLRFAFFCLLVLFIGLHHPVTVINVLRGTSLSQQLLAPLRGFAIAMLAFTPVFLAVVAVENRGPRSDGRRALWLILALVGGHAIGVMLFLAAQPLILYGLQLPPHNYDPWVRVQLVVGRALWYLVYSSGALVLYLYVRKSRDAVAAMHGESVRREDMQRDNAQAKLQVMQAQIEPHFLFNTLASVRSLYRTDSAAGREMLRSLTSYLTASLPRMRETRSTLERELALSTAYLRVHKIRMGSRLAFAVDVPSALRTAHVPPMMLATLVENAIVHGLTPLPEGGSIRIAGRELGGKLYVDVIDDGCGLKGA